MVGVPRRHVTIGCGRYPAGHDQCTGAEKLRKSFSTRSPTIFTHLEYQRPILHCESGQYVYQGSRFGTVNVYDEQEKSLVSGCASHPLPRGCPFQIHNVGDPSPPLLPPPARFDNVALAVVGTRPDSERELTLKGSQRWEPFSIPLFSSAALLHAHRCEFADCVVGSALSGDR